MKDSVVSYSHTLIVCLKKINLAKNQKNKTFLNGKSCAELSQFIKTIKRLLQLSHLIWLG